MPVRKPNLWPFSSSKKAKGKSRPRSSKTVGQSMADAYRAGQQSGDDGLFNSWAEREGLAGHSKTLKARLKREYTRGVLGGETRGTAKTARSASSTYKGYTIKTLESGSYVIPKLDPDSHFDSLSDAKRFLDSWKRNPAFKKAVTGAQSGGRDVLKLYDNVSGAIWAVTGGIPRRILGAAAGEKNPPEITDRAKRYARRIAGLKSERGTGGGSDMPDWVNNPRNPASSSDRMYRAFHGKDPQGETVVKEELHQHEHLAPLGVLVNFKVRTRSGFDQTIGTADAEAERLDYDETVADADSVFLASNEDGTQLYFVGGDQSFPLDKCKMGENTAWFRDDMIIGVLYEITYRTKKKFDKFKLTDYYHHLGEETGDQPMLRYDPLSPHLYVTGGKYKIKVPLIGMSPGIEN